MGFLMEEEHSFLGIWRKPKRTLYITVEGIFVVDDGLNIIGECTDPPEEAIRTHDKMKRDRKFIQDWVNKK